MKLLITAFLAMSSTAACDSPPPAEAPPVDAPPEAAPPAASNPACPAQPLLPMGPEPAFERVVLVTIDTLRPDHLGAYGYPRPTSPFIDRLAQQGVVFERAMSTASLTSPSHASIFTSRLPVDHGVTTNGVDLASDVPTLACLFAGSGYRTAAFTSTRFLQKIALGFETTNDPDISRFSHAPAKAVIDDAITALPQGRSLTWVHFYDVHQWIDGAVYSKEDIATLDAEDGLSPDALVALVLGLHGTPPGQSWGQLMKGDDLLVLDATPDNIVKWTNHYDSQIRVVDAQLQRLYDTMAATTEPTLWIVTSDHGEGLGAHGYHGHLGHIYDEHVRVPLIVWASDGRFAPRRVSAPVSLVDVLPTVADLQGVTTLPGEVEGVSLVPLLEGSEAQARGPLFFERRAVDSRKLLNAFSTQPIQAAQQGSLKYIRYEDQDDELFDLSADPHEAASLMPACSAACEALRTAIAQRYDAAPAPEEEQISDETKEELRALGYVED